MQKWGKFHIFTLENHLFLDNLLRLIYTDYSSSQQDKKKNRLSSNQSIPGENPPRYKISSQTRNGSQQTAPQLLLSPKNINITGALFSMLLL